MDDKDNRDYKRGYRDGYNRAIREVEAARARSVERLREIADEYDKERKS